MNKATTQAVCAPMTEMNKATTQAVCAPMSETNKATTQAVCAPMSETNKATTQAVCAPMGEMNKATTQAVCAPMSERNKATTQAVCAPMSERNKATTQAVCASMSEMNKATTQAVCAPMSDRNKATMQAVCAPMSEMNKATTQAVCAPTSETKKLFLYEINEKITGKYQYHSTLSGKWVLFYRKQSVDKVWKEVCRLYHEEQLEGIEFLKTSTAKFNDRLKDSDLGMISFICGPCDDLELVTKYGTSLLKSLQPLAPFDVETMPYMACGTGTPSGATSAHDDCTVLSSLEIPKAWRAEVCLHSCDVLTTRNKPVGSPRAETEEIFLFEFDLETEEKYKYDPSEGGKWMLYYQYKSMDNMWTKACSLYREGELTGVSSMKVSTTKYNPRQSTYTKGVIIFYCGPSSDEDLMKSYGKCILEKMHRFGPFDTDHMPYKTDDQSDIGTRATGSLRNTIYSLPIPEEWRSENCQISVLNSNVSSKDLPSQVLDKYWLIERQESISSKWPCDPYLIGQWLMVFEEAWLDSAWKKARDLYHAGKLTGIQSMSVSTAMMIKDRDDRQKIGFINCFCGPKDDLDLVMTYGENLAEVMNYWHGIGSMNYKYRKETLCRVKVSSYWHPKKLDRNQSTSSGYYATNDVRSWRKQ